MRRKLSVVTVTLLASTLCLANSTYVVPTTTLAAQTANNTSAANIFKTQSNDNRGAGNISKVDVHTLLYPGATTKIYAHFMGWFGGSNHMNVGYSSTDPTQVKDQIDDLVSRGIDGVIIDWYGPNNSTDQATQLVMAQAETHPGFTFAIMIDAGAIARADCSGCSPQQELVSELQYMEHTYFSSPAYMTIQGQPMVTNFNVDLSYPSIDWTAVTAALSTHPAFIFQNNDGFTHVLTDGSYSWVMPRAGNYGMDYLTSFYDTGLSYPKEETFGAAYKGFNDSLASWGANRIMNQQCGQTWLQTFSKINSMYNSGKPLPYLQLVTWNDYEEATEIESGIDNCLTVSASSASNSLQWSISGNENTVDHYTVYISEDGENLMPLTDIASEIHSLNLCGFPIPDGNYKLFVQAVGKPTLANQMSGVTSYTATCATGQPTPPPAPSPTPAPTPNPTLSFSASPASLTISAGTTGSLTVTAKPQSGSFNNSIALSCSGMPSTMSCSFSPASITPGSGMATSVVTISSKAATGTNPLPPRNPTRLYGSLLLSFGIVGFGFLEKGAGKRGTQGIALCAVIALGMLGASCGSARNVGSESAVSAATPVHYSVTIHGNSNASQLSTTINVIVQ
ncbi:MAG: endo-1,3-alpha-glucanase family glycosylhydrolase [Candidatus Sulfotelmatobacter sp.]